MNIYEVFFWSSHGKSNSEDTIYLVRAPDFLSAVEDVQRNGAPTQHGTESSLPDGVHEVGVDLSPYAQHNPRILRGPYFESAFNFGWKSWRREWNGSEYTNKWIEEEIDSIGKVGEKPECE